MKTVLTNSHGQKSNIQSDDNLAPDKRSKPDLPRHYHKKNSEPHPLEPIDIRRFVRMPIPKPTPLLGTWLMMQTLCLIHAARGCGKTYLALWIALAVAAGHDLFSWKCMGARKVVYLDGEMSAGMLQLRIKAIPKLMRPALGMFSLVTPDFQRGVLPDLSTHEGQAMINNAIEADTALIIVDNLSCWSKSGREDAETWAPIAEWALRHRAEGRSVIFIHHSGKTGTQRGTSRKEDLLDVVLALKKSAGSSPGEGASFEIRYEKNRHLIGDDVAPIKVRLIENEEGVQYWKWKIIRDQPKDRLEQILKLKEQGLSQAQIAQRLGVNRSTVSRALRE